MTLEQLTDELKHKFGDGSPIRAVVKFDFGDEGVLRIDGTVDPTQIDNQDGDAACTIRLKKDTFESIAQGKTNAQMAFMTGKLKVEGSLGIAMQLTALLD